MSRNAVESFGGFSGEPPTPNARAEAIFRGIKESRAASSAA
jgi:hypothetical protein